MNIAPSPPWRMAIIACIIQNCATALTFGTFGTIVLAIEAKYHTNRTLASLGISLALLALSLAAPFVGAALIRKIPIRRAMFAGVALGMIGYSLLAISTSIYAVLAIYMVLIGPSFALFGALPCNTLTATWFGQNPGRALGLVNIPVLVMIFPFGISALLTNYGLSTVFITVAAAHIFILPFIMLVQEGPYVQTAQERSDALPARAIMMRKVFVLLVIGIGILTGTAMMKVAHLVPIVTGQGYSLNFATLLFALSAGTGILGSLFFGWLADRIGGVPSLIINAAIQSVTFFILLAPVGPGLLILDSVIIGACGGGVVAINGVIFGRIFGPRNFGRVFGLVSLCTLPFSFGISPIVSMLFDMTGDYTLPISVMISALAFACLILSPLIKYERRALAQSFDPINPDPVGEAL